MTHDTGFAPNPFFDVLTLATCKPGIRRVSRPGRRVYVRHEQIPRVLSGLGISIISTSTGLMSDKEARRRKVGGELLCEVW